MAINAPESEVPSNGQAAAEKILPAPFLKTILADWQTSVSHAFLVHGGVFDFIEHPTRNQTLRDYLVGRLGAGFSIVSFSPDEGTTFDGPSNVADPARERFLSVVSPDDAPLDSGAPLSGAGLLAAQAGSSQAEAPQGELPKTAASALPLLVKFLAECYGGKLVRDDDGRPKLDENGRRVYEGGDGSGQRAAVIVDRLDLICPPGEKGMQPDERLKLLSLLHRAGTSSVIAANGNLLILLSPSLEEVHPDLRLASSGIKAIEIPPPDYAQRLAFAEREIARREVKLEDGLRLTDLASATAGLFRRHIQDLALRAAAQPDRTITRDFVRERKREQMNSEYAEVLEVLDPKFTLAQVGGHELAKDFLAEEVVACMRDEKLLNYVPLGIAFLGPPGTGKTMLANALAAEIGFNCVLLRADKIRGGIVGESERKLAKAIAGIEALSPCVVFIDEVDQKINRVTSGGGGGGDSVEGNIFSRLLEFFGDSSHRGRILGIAASNRPDLVDAALFRPGRFDVKIPLLPPVDAAERARVLRALLDRYGEDGVAESDLLDLGEQTQDWTQAELERLVVLGRSIRRIRKQALPEALRRAKARLRNRTRSTQDMIALALNECDDLELIPEVFRKLGTPEAIEAARGRAAREQRASRGDFERGSADRSVEGLDLDLEG